MAEARRSGSFYARVERAVGPGAGHVEYDGGAVVVSGTVELLNLHVEGGEPHPYDYRVVVDIDREAARPVVQELTVVRRPAGPDVSARGVQGARLGEVGAVAVSYLTRSAPSNPQPLGITEESATRLVETARPRRGRPPISPADHERVAEIHARAVSAGETPGKAVAREMGLTYSTARNRISDARRAGYL